MIRKFLKGQKGINLISLTIAVLVILVLTNVIIFNVKDNLKIERLKSLQTDIANLRDKVSNYYARFGTIPIVDIEYKNIDHIKQAGLISEVSDSGRFYAIDLDKLENLTLNYGRDYKKITPSSTESEVNGYTDLYIINASSHNIFYVKGVKIDNDWYYTDYLAEDIDLKSIDLKYVDNVKIPDGFHYVDGDKETGIVISDVEGDDINNSKKGNQYVWVPVEDFEEFVRKDFGKQSIPNIDFVDTEKTASKYYEESSNGIAGKTEAEKMYKSVKKYKGFFIARFEAGKTSNGEVVSKKGESVYNSVKWGNADESGGAVALARNVYPSSDEGEVISTLCYGVQWDAIMNWINKDNNLSQYLTDSSQIGNYSNSASPAETGANDKYQVKNIYDLAGNVGEWTMENYNQNNYVIRGGDFSKTDSNYKTLASRDGGTLDYTNANTGFRVALYLNPNADIKGDKLTEVVSTRLGLMQSGNVVKLSKHEGVQGNNWNEVTVQEYFDYIDGVKKIYSTESYCYVIDNSGYIYVWENDYSRQCQIEDSGEQLNPVKVEGVSNVEEIYTMGGSVIVKTTSGELYAWGSNSNGELGIGNTESQVAPVKISVLNSVEDVYTLDWSVIAKTKNGELYAWGSNFYGQLGIGNTEEQLSPVKIAELSNVEKIYALSYGGVIAKTTSGELYAWGSNSYGQLGIGNTESQSKPVKIEGISNVEEIYREEDSVIAKTQNGDLYGWGNNSNGELGTGNTESQLKPKNLDWKINLDRIDETGYQSWIAKTKNGDLYAWGKNSYGQLGIGNTDDRLSLAKVQEVSNVEEMYAIDGSVIAKTTNGELCAWGNNFYGQLGIGNTEDQSSPMKIAGLSNVEKIYMLEYGGVIAKTINGELYAWGNNEDGILGIENTGIQLIPTKIEGIENVIDLYEFDSGFEYIVTNDGKCYENYNIILN